MEDRIRMCNYKSATLQLQVVCVKKSRNIEENCISRSMKDREWQIGRTKPHTMLTYAVEGRKKKILNGVP